MWDVVIIGSGPAGLCASVYAKRAGLAALTIEKNPMGGGQILNTYEVDNYPGLPKINGFDLGSRFLEHAGQLGCEFRTAEVKGISRQEGIFLIETEEESIKTRAVIAAMGARNAHLNCPGEERLIGRGVSYCATCDGAFYRDKVTAVVGGGDVAVEDAIYLSGICRKVYLIHRREELRAADSLQKELLRLSNVEMIWNTTVEEILGNDRVEELRLFHKENKEERRLRVDGIFVAVGILPDTGLLTPFRICDEKGYVPAGEDCVTGEAGLFAAGDIRRKPLRQIVTAVADGANAVTSVQEYLRRSGKNVTKMLR